MFQLVLPFQLELPFGRGDEPRSAERRSGDDRRARPRDARDRRRGG